jgi:hypothetical protein
MAPINFGIDEQSFGSNGCGSLSDLFRVLSVYSVGLFQIITTEYPEHTEGRLECGSSFNRVDRVAIIRI